MGGVFQPVPRGFDSNSVLSWYPFFVASGARSGVAAQIRTSCFSCRLFVVATPFYVLKSTSLEKTSALVWGF